MTWFDGVLLAIAAGVILVQARGEAGQGLLDAVATLCAVHFSPAWGSALTASTGWRPLPGTELSPVAHALSFAVLLALGLCLSRAVHRQTRWSMDQYDLLFSLGFGALMAVVIGHVVTDVTARMALLHGGAVPDYLHGSMVAEELRSFRTYQYVINICGGAHRGR